MYTIAWYKKSALQQIPTFETYGATFKNENDMTLKETDSKRMTPA
jgi:hypothetical protein